MRNREDCLEKLKAIKEEFTTVFRKYLRQLVDKADDLDVNKTKAAMMRLEARTFRVRADLADLAAEEAEAPDAKDAPVIDPTNIDIPDSFGGL